MSDADMARAGAELGGVAPAEAGVSTGDPGGAKSMLAENGTGILDADPKLRGDSFARNGDLKAAADCYRTAIRSGNATAEVHNNLANVMKQLGDVAIAEVHYRRALSLNPGLAESLSNLGVILAEQKKLDQAIDCFEKALGVNPQLENAIRNLANALAGKHDFEAALRAFAPVRNSPSLSKGGRLQLADLLVAAGRPEEAIPFYSDFVQQTPMSFQARIGLARALLTTKHVKEALRHSRQAVEIQPLNSRAQDLLGLCLQQSGAVPDAMIHFRRAIELDPKNALVHLHLGNCFEWLGRYSEALEQYRRAVVLDPAMADAHNNLGNALLHLGRHEEARRQVAKAIELDPDLAEAHSNLSAILYEIGKYDEAAGSARKAIAINGQLAEAYGNLGTILLTQGDVDAAKDNFLRALKIRPDAVFAINGMAHLEHFDCSDRTVELTDKLLAEPHSGDRNKSVLHYLQARIFDARGESEKAFAAASKGNEIEARKNKFDVNLTKKAVNRAIELFTPEFFANRSEFGSSSEEPIFVVGLPRSGTSLVEQILASHSRVFGAGELPYLGVVARNLRKLSRAKRPYPEGLADLDRQSVMQLAGTYLRQVRALSGNAERVVDKLPSNSIRLGLVSLLFPKARVIVCKRNPLDVFISSHFLRFSHSIPYIHDQADFAAFYLEHERILQHWRAVLRTPVLEMNYEDLVKNQEEKSRQILEFCGLDWEPQCLDFHLTKRPVRTGSTLQVRQPIYTTSVGRSQQYEQHLGTLKEALSR